MSTTLSDYAENKVIDHLCGTSAWVMPAAVSIALFTTNPNFETGAGGSDVNCLITGKEISVGKDSKDAW